MYYKCIIISRGNSKSSSSRNSNILIFNTYSGMRKFVNPLQNLWIILIK